MQHFPQHRQKDKWQRQVVYSGSCSIWQYLLQHQLRLPPPLWPASHLSLEPLSYLCERPVLVKFLVLVLNSKLKYLFWFISVCIKKISPTFKKNPSLGQFWNHAVSMSLTWCFFYQQGIANKHFNFKIIVILLFASNSVSPFQDQLFRGLWTLSNTVRCLDGISQVLKLICPSLFLVCSGDFFCNSR